MLSQVAPSSLEDHGEVFGEKNLAQAEIEIGFLLLMEAKDPMSDPSRGRV